MLNAASGARWVDLGAAGPEATATQLAANRIQITFTPRGFELRPVTIAGATWQQPLLPGGALLMEKGAPALPTLSGSVLLPPAGTVQMRVKIAEYRDYTDIRVAPSKGVLYRNVNPATVPYTFGPAYQAAQWPPQVATLGQPYILRDYRGVTVQVCPFQYYPGEDRLRVYTRVVVELEITADRGANELSAADAARAPSAAFSDIYARHFLNYTASPARRYTPLADQGEMLIIGKDSLLGAVQPLVDWKRQKGIRTAVVPFSSIGTTPAQLKSFVTNYYATNGLVFLLLVGDAEDIPPMYASGGASDPSYSKIVGNDNLPDILVGRFSGSTTQQIANMAARTLRYERNPEPAGAWYRAATGIASAEGEDPSDIEHMNAIRTNLLNGYYTSVDQIYDPGASKTALSNAVCAGRGLINYVGHGAEDEWVTTAFNNTDVGRLTNTSRWPFIFDVACVNGAFTGMTCFAEAWLRAERNGQPAGALAMYASTINQDWSSPMTAQNEFNALLLAASKKSYGGLCFNASIKMMEVWGSVGVEMFDTWTIFGDPSAQVRTLTPSNITVTHAASLNSLNYTVQVANASGALAALSLTNQLLGSAWADGSGKAVIALAAQPPADVLLTVTAFNAIPYTATVAVAAAQLGVTPAAVAEPVAPGQTRQCALVITNSGAPGSILAYTIAAMPDYSQSRAVSAAAPAVRSIAGSLVRLNPTSYTAGASATLTITVTNASTDDEWLTQLVLKFPSEVNVTSATRIYGDNVNMTNNGATGSGAVVTWNGKDSSGFGAIMHRGTGSISVAIAPSAAGDLPIGWSLTGDNWGEEPHTVTGLVVLSTTAPPAPALTLTAPLGGQSWAIGSTQAITWTSINYTNTVNLDYSINGGASWSSVAAGQPNSSSYLWTVNAAQSSNCRVRVTSPNGTIASTSPAPFGIYYPLTWLSFDQSSGAITGRQANTITLTLNAAGLAPGAYHAILRVDTACGVSNIPVEMIVLAATNYDAWAAQITNGLTAYNQCATGDGYPNLLKYATGSSPTHPDQLAQLSGTESNRAFSLRFNRNTNALDITLIVEGRGMIGGGAPWVGIATNRSGAWTGPATVTETGTGSPVSVFVRDTVSNAISRFLRVRVTQP